MRRLKLGDTYKNLEVAQVTELSFRPGCCERLAQCHRHCLQRKLLLVNWMHELIVE